jgi:hypothetical protein
LGYYQPRRRHRRFRRQLVRVLVDYYAGGEPHCEYATTLGAGGLFIETDAPLAPGSLLCVRFRLPGGSGLHSIAPPRAAGGARGRPARRARDPAPGAEQREVADQVERLVPHELVGEAQAAPVEHAVPPSTTVLSSEAPRARPERHRAATCSAKPKVRAGASSRSKRPSSRTRSRSFWRPISGCSKSIA